MKFISIKLKGQNKCFKNALHASLKASFDIESVNFWETIAQDHPSWRSDEINSAQIAQRHLIAEAQRHLITEAQKYVLLKTEH